MGLSVGGISNVITQCCVHLFDFQLPKTICELKDFISQQLKSSIYLACMLFQKQPLSLVLSISTPSIESLPHLVLLNDL